MAYADKRAQRRVVTLDERFARWTRKHPDMAAELAAARERAALLEAEICALAGVAPVDVAPATVGPRARGPAAPSARGRAA